MYSRDELKQLKVEFWEGFAAYCEVQPYLRGRKKMWRLYDTKVKGVEMKFDANRRGAYVILEVNHATEDSRLEMFEKLTWYKEALEKGMEELIWDICFVRESGEQVARIYTAHEGIDIHRRTHWGDFYRFMATQMYQLEKNFLAIADYLRD
ncbi:putative RNA-binding protein YlxR (DUF448 family) [Parabacteroides sp. PFB2-12]|uniref:DUF4268 domain-containing protein n=1 Tax=unclassified Parabacteroides TaxID=2649774 RepID=UPI0024764689|nr:MULTISPECIES: DUF4268 domain-containing protein [unclassified Parabacteroides]MDH6343954.1 putative RNA-binding protein YlxR (DUF448 family) [Parabacteroides sp. PM6-13]MDH6391685.1 putative RNA-binding protein YlxR (DUF448 family) [Parabacteroides sp. PFB2-12]